MYAIFGCASDFGYNFRHLTPTTLNCGATVHRRCISNSKIYHSNKGSVVHLKGYGLIKVFKIVSLNGDIEYWATNDLSMNELFRLKYAELSWSIEVYHRGIKQFVGVESCMAPKAVAQHNHIGLALRAFLRIERHSFCTGISWFEAKTSIIGQAVRAYLAKPIYTLNLTA